MLRALIGLVIFTGVFGDKPTETGEIHAVLVAGSDGWWNYRHQADICHAYHILIDHGVKPENIITLMADDIAHNRENPFPGKIFNHPNMTHDVYAGVKIDYKGKDVTPENFLAVLQGQTDKVRGGNGRVLNTGKNDKIFVNFADHGATGLIAFPNSVLTVKQLNTALKSMHSANKFSELVFYLEACESGSMFQAALAKNINVYALTASNAVESSWGCYCGGQKIYTCLGDLFSVNWMEDTDREDIRRESLEKQFEIVKKATTKSHVMKYGDLKITDEPVADFQGEEKSRSGRVQAESDVDQYEQWSSREIPLLTLQKQHEHTDDPLKQAALEMEIQQMIMKREYLRLHVQGLAKKLLPDSRERSAVLATKPAEISQPDCHHDVVHAFDRICFPFGRSPYALEYVHVLANLCDRLPTQRILDVMMDHCLDVHYKDIS